MTSPYPTPADRWGGGLGECMISRGKLSRESLSLLVHSIRFRLVMWFVLILGVVMLVFSAFIYWRQSQDVWSVALSRLNATLERTAGVPEGDHDFEQQSSLSVLSGVTPQIDSNPVQDSIIALQAPDGTIIQVSGLLTTNQIEQLELPLPGWKGVEQANVLQTGQPGSGLYLFVNPAIMRNSVVAGYLLVGVPLDANNQLGRLLVTLIIGNLVTLAIAISGGFWLADQALRPVKTITQTAQEISATDLNRRLHMPGRDELSALAATFDAMLDRLQAAFERQRQFTADASHELRTPLTIIDLETSRMLSGRRSAEEYEHVLATIKSENKFMIRLVTNLLQLARMDAGQLKLENEPLDLSELASEVIERVAPLAKAQRVALLAGDLPETIVMGDRATLVQMLTNLVENAIKYSAGVAAPQVKISAGRREEAGQAMAWIQVSDNGIGIPKEHQARLFDRFYQVDAARTRQEKPDGEAVEQESSGTGLGLAIAQWIAEAHHGEVRVTSTPGQGSTFEVLLPEYRPGME